LALSWIFLFVAGLCEVGWAVLLKLSVGFTKLGFSAATLAVMAASVYFLSLALRGIQLGTAYAVWTGIGAVGVAVIGMIAFGESREALRLASIGLVVAGIVGLRLSGG
jgi:quaternary ammonium compound-resistance protein SugE